MRDNCAKEHVYEDNREKTAPAYLPLPPGWIVLKEPDVEMPLTGYFAGSSKRIEGEWRHFDSWRCVADFVNKERAKESAKQK